MCEVMMRRIITLFFILVYSAAFSEGSSDILITGIIADIDKFKNTVVVAEYRLKYVDRIFEKIIFYDSENVDIEFDISGKTKKEQLSGNMINIHEGMKYRIKFTVIGAGAMGGLTGDLIEFTPVIFDKIPTEDIK